MRRTRPIESGISGAAPTRSWASRRAWWRALLGLGLILLLGGQTTNDGLGRSTGLPVPRVVSLGDDEVNLRYGPGAQYPVKWIYQRAGLPVTVVDEFDVWRQIRDPDGDEGWIHQSLLSGKRQALITGEVRGLRRQPDENARIVLRAEPGVIGDLLECEFDWCQVEIEGRRGWLARDEFYGALPDEIFR